MHNTKQGTGSTTPYVVVVIVFNSLRWQVIVNLSDINGINDHHCLNFYFHNIIFYQNVYIQSHSVNQFRWVIFMSRIIQKGTTNVIHQMFALSVDYICIYLYSISSNTSNSGDEMFVDNKGVGGSRNSNTARHYNG